MAMDELERAMLDPRVNPACSSRIFLHMMPELTAVPKDVVVEWKKVSGCFVDIPGTRYDMLFFLHRFTRYVFMNLLFFDSCVVDYTSY